MGDPGAGSAECPDAGGVLRGRDPAGPGATQPVGYWSRGGSVSGVARVLSVALAVGRRWARRPLRDWRPDPGGVGYRRLCALGCVLRGPQVRAPRKPRSSTQPPLHPKSSWAYVCVWRGGWPLSHNGNLTAVLFCLLVLILSYSGTALKKGVWVGENEPCTNISSDAGPQSGRG
uniref:Microtubule-associated protein 1 light chain 3 beta n=1 Tax=Mus musculus TaxID=10090 RepID=A0A1D5RLG5_MOUSE